VVVVLHLAAVRRIEVPGQRPLVPGARRIGIPRVPVEVADRLRQLGPAGPEGGALVERDRLVDAACAARSSAVCSSTTQ
jgi:hypothetical protein